MTIREAKNVLNRAGYRITEHHDGSWSTPHSSWEKKEDGWRKNGRPTYTDNSFPGSLYEGIKQNLLLMGLVIDDNDPNGRAVQEALWKVENIITPLIGTDSDIPGPINDWF